VRNLLRTPAALLLAILVPILGGFDRKRRSDADAHSRDKLACETKQQKHRILPY
jgi:hypothetical protein